MLNDFSSLTFSALRLFPSLTTYPYLIELLITLVIREVPIPNISLHLLTVADCISDEVNVSLIKIANESASSSSFELNALSAFGKLNNIVCFI